LNERLGPAEPIDPRRITPLPGDLDSDRFAVLSAAERDLAKEVWQSE
jgi:hypothetical protein